MEKEKRKKVTWKNRSTHTCRKTGKEVDVPGPRGGEISSRNDLPGKDHRKIDTVHRFPMLNILRVVVLVKQFEFSLA